MQLVELWLQTHFLGIPAMVFFDPLGDGNDRIQQIASRLDIHSENNETLINMISADIFIHPVPLEHLSEAVDNCEEDVFGFVVGWDGAEIVTENT